jgi:thymidylate synthase (FAD)
MIEVTPKVYLIADPNDTGQLEQFLTDNHIAWRPDPKVSFTENVMELAGRLCYESWETDEGTFSNLNLTKIRTGNQEYIGNIIKQGHGSVLEHGGPLTYIFNNVSRCFTHELVRHRVGTAYSQTSGRYVRYDDLKFWIPPCISENSEAKEIFVKTINAIEHAQKRLAAIYDINNRSFAEKKALTSAFRRIAPNGLANNIMFSTNHRNMRHVITMRANSHAEEEIRLIFSEIAEDLLQRFPSIYQDLKQLPNGDWFFSI